MESQEIDDILTELKKSLEALNNKMKNGILVETSKHKKIYKEMIELAGELNDFFAE